MHLCDADDNESVSPTEFDACVRAFAARSFGAPAPDAHAHEHKRKKRTLRAALHASRKRQVAAAAAVNETVVPACKLPVLLMGEFDVDGNAQLSLAEFGFAVPSLLLVSSGACRLPAVNETMCDHVPPDSASAWGAGIGASLILSLVSLCGIVVIPFQNRTFRERVMTPMISFAVGALIGDALLHLIPQAIGAHSHEAENEEEAVSYVWYMMVTLLGVVAFFVLERHIEHMHGPDDHHEHHHHHDHHHGTPLAAATAAKTPTDAVCDNPAHTHDDPVDPALADGVPSEDESSSRRRRSGRHKRSRRRQPLGNTSSRRALAEASAELPTDSDPATKESASPSTDEHEHEHAHDGPQRILTVGWLNLISDAVHNFVDGIAIGAAFSFSLEVGLATSIAIFCHELPQELADYAILIHAGFTKTQALGLNLLTALTSVIGAAIGLGIGTTAVANSRWLLAFTAGNFLYIALADMVQSLHQVRGWRQTLIQLLLMCVGIFIMLGLTFVEEALVPEECPSA